MTPTGSTKADEMAKKQREISVAEFFEKNRHLLGFDNPRKALLTTVKEAVDNSLDACEEAGILPELSVEMIEMAENRFRIIVEDNGPGIVKKQIPNIFAKLLYGSKFHSMKQSRGQQGIGISAAALYGQLTTGKPIKIVSRIGENKPAHYYELHIDTKTNKPVIAAEKEVEWASKQGTRLELDLEATYQKGTLSVDTYLKQTAVANPHVTIIYTNPKAEQIIFPRAVNQLPKEAKEIKPHPYGVELGMFIKLVGSTEARTIQSFLMTDFSRVSSAVAKEICQKAKVLTNTKPRDVSRDIAERLVNAIKDTKIVSPPTDCISPIGADDLEKGLKKEINAEFYCSVTRAPSVYRGNPFVIEVGLAYGGDQAADSTIRLMRFANRVPLLYQPGACSITKSIQETNWKSYGLQQSRSSLPVGPLTVVIHMASVWVPFTSEAKEALAHYPEIIKDIKLGIQEAGRQLSKYVNKKKRIGDELKKRSYIEKYIPHVASALKDLLKLSKAEEDKIKDELKDLLEIKRGKIKDIRAVNEEYDQDFAKIGEEVVEEVRDNIKDEESDEE
ncbi:DNA topoisomerase VI subunit B, partial [Nanoarchaeota archaeon]